MAKSSMFRGALIGCCLIGIASLAWGADFRTWSDVSGRFKIKAKFVSLKGDTITLEKEDGSEIQLPLKKLSTIDQTEAKKLATDEADNPFNSTEDNPFEGKKSSSEKSENSKPSSGAGKRSSGRRSGSKSSSRDADDGNVDTIDAPISTAPTITVPVADRAVWNVPVPASKESEFSTAPKSVSIPSKEFFESSDRIALNPRAKKAVMGYFLREPGDSGPGKTRLVIADLATGHSTNGSPIPGNFRPLALSDDGKTLLVHRVPAGFGRGEDHYCEVWKLKGENEVTRLAWMPFPSDRNGEITWGAFIGSDKLALASRAGTIGFWKLDGLEPLFQLMSGSMATPAISPDQKLIAFSDGDRLAVLDIDKREVLASVSITKQVRQPVLAFSPTGKQIGCVGADRVLLWETSTGKVIGDMDSPTVHISGSAAVPADNYVLAKEHYLFNLEKQTQTWHYSGNDVAASAGGWTFFAVNSGEANQQGALLAMQIPHAGIKDLQERAQKDPSLYVLREGTVVKIDVSGLPDQAERPKVIAELTKQLEQNKFKAGDSGTITLVATLDGPKQRDLRYRRAGTYKYQEVKYGLKFVYNGTTVWQQVGTNVPHAIRQGRDETFEMALKKHEKPDYNWYGKHSLPTNLQKPSSGAPVRFGRHQQQQSGFGFGQSQLTPTGMK